MQGSPAPICNILNVMCATTLSVVHQSTFSIRKHVGSNAELHVARVVLSSLVLPEPRSATAIFLMSGPGNQADARHKVY